MVLRAAAACGVLLREPQAGQRLARVEDAAAGAGDGFDVAVRGGGGADRVCRKLSAVRSPVRMGRAAPIA
jgi:hypothetical protein